MLLSLLAVHLFETEELPADIETGVVPDLTDPSRRLVCEWAHEIEMEVHGGSAGTGFAHTHHPTRWERVLVEQEVIHRGGKGRE